MRSNEVIALDTLASHARKLSRGESTTEEAAFHISLVVSLLPQGSKDPLEAPFRREGKVHSTFHWALLHFNGTLWNECQRTIKGASVYHTLAVTSQELARQQQRFPSISPLLSVSEQSEETR